MTCLTDVRDRTLTMLRVLGVEPDNRRMRTVERYVRWVDGQISAAHIDGRALEREVAGGHEIDDQGSFEIGRFPTKPVWTGDGVQWRRDTPPETVPPGGA